MIVSHAHEMLFVHVQKTGGTTVDGLLQRNLPDAERVADLPGSSKHATLGTALERHPEFADYWVFGFVRNPWARMYSWYSMIRRRQGLALRGEGEAVRRRVRNNRFWAGVLEACPDFETFVMECPSRFGRLRRPQVAYLRTPAKSADFIGRTETLATDLRQVFDHLGVPPPTDVPQENAGPRRDYRDHYTPEMRAQVARLFEPDIRKFGYEF